MESSEILEQFKKYDERDKKENSELLLSPTRSLLFIDACTKNEIAILGIEGFIKEQQKIIPRTDIIADFSSFDNIEWNEYLKKITFLAKQFILDFSNIPNILFHLVIKSKKDFKIK